MSEPESKTFLEHIEDLRWVLVKSFACIAIGIVFGFIYTREIIALLVRPLRLIGHDPEKFLRVLGVIDPFSIQIELGLSAGVLLGLPFVLYFVGRFLLPALHTREKRLLLPVFTIGAFLFMAGVAFCYFLLLPQTLTFMMKFNAYLGFQTEWTIQSYLDFTIQMLLAFGLSFELPLIIIILNYLGIVSNAFLRQHRRHAILVNVIAASCIMPADPISMAMLALPMMLLYEICLVATWFMEKRQMARSTLTRDESPTD